MIAILEVRPQINALKRQQQRCTDCKVQCMERVSRLMEIGHLSNIEQKEAVF